MILFMENNTWNLEQVKHNLNDAFEENSEVKLLEILKNNSFLFYELFKRKWGIQPVFREIAFGNQFRCDFAWLNDNSDGPEWTLLEVEKPKMKLFTQKGEPTSELNHAIEQVKSWRRYFENYPGEKKRIFGAVSRFRYLLVGGELSEWQKENPAKWRIDHNRNEEIEIRSSDVFLRPLEILEKKAGVLWSFAEHPNTLSPSELNPYWEKYKYMDHWRKIIP